MAESIVIVGAKRTPIGSMQGKFNAVSASQLGAVAIKAAIEQAGVKPTEVDDLIFGNVLQAGQGDRKSTRLNSSHIQKSRMPSSA